MRLEDCVGRFHLRVRPDKVIDVSKHLITGWTFIAHTRFGSFRRLLCAKRTYRRRSQCCWTRECTRSGWSSGRGRWWRSTMVGMWGVLPAGLIGIQAYYLETPDDFIRPVPTCLEYRDAEHLVISTECSLHRVPQFRAISKMSAAAEAARSLRETG
jgi:5-methyltetrahydropteroyltriglutamate--homocysteine methyltransferase